MNDIKENHTQVMCMHLNVINSQYSKLLYQTHHAGIPTIQLTSQAGHCAMSATGKGVIGVTEGKPAVVFGD